MTPKVVFAEPGEPILITVTIGNAGTSALHLVQHSDGVRGVGVSFHLLAGSGEVLVADNPRRYFPDAIPAGQHREFVFPYRVPHHYGHFRLAFDLVHDGFRWFHTTVEERAIMDVYSGVHRGPK